MSLGTAQIARQLVGVTAARWQGRRALWKTAKQQFGSFSRVVRPGKVTEEHDSLPPGLQTPEYWPHGKPGPSPRQTEVKDAHQIQGMRRATAIARQVMDTIGQHVQVGVSTEELNRVAHRAAVDRNSFPSPLQYRGFPKSICTSVNNVACHGVPDDRRLATGDLISVDVTVYHGGYHGDCCETWCLPGTDEAGHRLVDCAREARDRSIAACRPGLPFNNIGRICEETAHSAGLTIVPVFIGHGIGSYFHGPPDVYHFTNSGSEVMTSGMTFTVEPIVAQGKEGVVILDDGWTAMMVDHGRAAQFEHTVLITDDGHEILTQYNDEGRNTDDNAA